MNKHSNIGRKKTNKQTNHWSQTERKETDKKAGKIVSN